MLKEVNKVKVKATLDNMRVAPFDVMYFFHKKDKELASRIFECCLMFKMRQTLLDKLLAIPFNLKEYIGPTRKSHKSTALKDAVKLGDLTKAVTTSSWMVVPIKPRSKGGKVTPSYVMNRRISERLRKRQDAISTHGWKYEEDAIKSSRILYDVELQVSGDFNCSPCSVCSRGLKKAADYSACMLGTQECLDHILFKRTKSFHEKAEGTPSQDKQEA